MLFKQKIRSFILMEVLVSVLLISVLALAIFRFFTYFNQQYYTINRINQEFLTTSNFIIRFKKDLDDAEEIIYNNMAGEILLHIGTDERSYTFEPNSVVFRQDEKKITYAVHVKNMEVRERAECPYIRGISFDLEVENQKDLVFSYKKQYFKAMDYHCQ